MDLVMVRNSDGERKEKKKEGENWEEKEGVGGEKEMAILSHQR